MNKSVRHQDSPMYFNTEQMKKREMEVNKYHLKIVHPNEESMRNIYKQNKQRLKLKMNVCQDCGIYNIKNKNI